jgi:(E)-4-hydroxy-3-methyl-but-2-enyl pyrophosphate reductase
MASLEVRISESAGFCPGVERALELTLDAAEEAPKPVCTLGPLIHNPSVVAHLKAKGVGVISEASELAAGTVILRSHGVPRNVREGLLDSGLNVVDATCPFVTSAQEKAAHLREAGYLVIILGDRDHPEVLALRSYAGELSLVVESAADLPDRLPGARIGVVVQTTQSAERLSKLVAALAPHARELLVHNTICNATEQRQAAALSMASEVDAVVVVGGAESGNTRRLAELCRGRQPRTYHVEAAGELHASWFEEAEVVGVTAGASTPSEQIDAVAAALRSMRA